MSTITDFKKCPNVTEAKIFRYEGQVEKLFVNVVKYIDSTIIETINDLGYEIVLINGDKRQYFIMANNKNGEII